MTTIARYIAKFAALLLILLAGIRLPAQEAATGRIPVYEIPYVYPSEDAIMETLHRIRNYYEVSSPQTIVDSRTGDEITHFSAFNEFAEPSPGISSEYSYTHGVVLSAFLYITETTGDERFFANNSKFYDFVLTHLPYFQENREKIDNEKIGRWGRILDFHALDDCGSMGAALIKTYLKEKNEAYMPLIEQTAEHVGHGQFRLDDGTLARHRPQYQSVWADDMYMSVPFLTNMGVLTGDDAWLDDAVKQVLQMAQRLYIPEKELFDHGWSVTSGDYDPRFYWGRANGWVLMAMAELLGVLPEDYPGRDDILHLYRSMVRSLAGLQDGSGFWHNMVDKNNTYLETSCTAMFTYAVAKGINEGWINHVYGPVALTGWNALSTRVLENGAVDGTCEGTTFAHDNTYYYHRGKSIHATHGYGPVLYAGAEMIRLLRNEKIEVSKARPNSQNSTFHYLLKSEWPEKELRAFPGAEGFGAYSEGGRGGKVLYVTNLKDKGPGSPRWAGEQKGPRTVVFSVSGTIDLNKRLTIKNPHITIAGQTAPGDGICLRGETLRIEADHVIIRHLRVRLGDGMQGKGSLQGKDAVSISSGKHIILDHCSTSWSLDEVLSASTSRPELDLVTVQWCFITEGLNPDNHGFGSLIRGTGGARYSFHHNLYAHNKGRNPRPGNYDVNSHDKDPEGLLLDFRNNVICNWGGDYPGYNNDSISVTRLNYVDNYLLPGADSKVTGIAYSTGSAFNRAYFSGNYYNGELPGDQWSLLQYRDYWSQEQIRAYKQDKAFDAGPMEKENALSAYHRILETGGASLPLRDPVDLRIVGDVRDRRGRIIKSQEDVGGWPELKSAPSPLDTDLDGMPDSWEKLHGLNPEDPMDRNKRSAIGYTMLEEYLNNIK